MKVLRSLNEIKERVVIVNGLSKGFAMTGWRLGYIAASAEIAKACEKLQGSLQVDPIPLAQRAAIVALKQRVLNLRMQWSKNLKEEKTGFRNWYVTFPHLNVTYLMALFIFFLT